MKKILFSFLLLMALVGCADKQTYGDPPRNERKTKQDPTGNVRLYTSCVDTYKVIVAEKNGALSISLIYENNYPVKCQ